MSAAVHLIHGNDPDAASRAIQDRVHHALAAVPERDRPLLLRSFDLADLGITAMRSEYAEPYLALRHGQLLPGPSVTVWRHADLLFDLNEEARWYPTRAIEHAAPGAVLIVQFKKFSEMSELGISIVQAVSLTRGGSATVCAKAGLYDKAGKAALVRRVAVECGVADRLDSAAEKELVTLSNGSAQQARLMLTRLRDVTGQDPILLGDIRRHCSADASVFDVMDAVIAGNSSKALQAIQQLQADRQLQNLRAMQGAITYCVRRAAMVICSPSDLARANAAWEMNVSKGAADRLRHSCSPDRIFAIWDVLLRWEADELAGGVENARRRLEQIADCARIA